MSHTPNASSDTLQEALYVLSTEKDVPNAKLLDDVVRRYPQFGEELTEFAIAIAVDALRGDRVAEASEAAFDPSAVSPTVARAMSYFQNRLHSMKAHASEAVRTRANIANASNPFLGLPRREFRAFAMQLNANTIFAGKLRDRQIDPTTMTPGFQRWVSEKLKVTLDVVVAHFAAPQAPPSNQFFKAEGKPSTGAQQSFKDAVISSGLSEAQQHFLLEL